MGRLVIQRAIKYGLRRIDYTNPVNKLVNKYAPPNYRPGLHKLVKISEAIIGGKTAYDIYMMFAEDSPGNGSLPPYEQRIKTNFPDKTRSGQSRRFTSKYSRRCKPYKSSRRTSFSKRF